MRDVVQIREAQKMDAERIVEMSHAVGAHEGMPASKLDKANFLAFGFGPDRVFDCYVAECEGRLVGHTCTTRGFDFQEGCPVLWIADLYVEPHYRRRGIARSLIAVLAKQAPRSGSSFVQWMIAPDNKLAKDFYLSIGARIDGGQPMYLGPKEIGALVSTDD